MINKIVDKIKKCKSAAIVSHINPDGDTVGSSLALMNELSAMGIKTYAFCDDALSDKLHYLPLTEFYNAGSADKYDIAFAVDCSDAARTGESAKELKKAACTVVIDHHKSNTKFGNINCIKTSAAATAEIIFEIITALKGDKLSARTATLLYAALVTDTGCFQFASVTPETLRCAASLMAAGIDACAITYNFMSKRSIKEFKLSAHSLDKTVFYNEGKIAVVCFLQEDYEYAGAADVSTDGIINAALNVDGVMIAAAISEVEKDDKYKISFRTKGDIDADRVAGIFGGGGHRNAAGCRINGLREEVRERVTKACADCLGE